MGWRRNERIAPGLTWAADGMAFGRERTRIKCAVHAYGSGGDDCVYVVAPLNAPKCQGAGRPRVR